MTLMVAEQNSLAAIITSGTGRDLIRFAAAHIPATFAAHCERQAKEHLAYATRSTSPTAARIASSCGRRCEQIAKAIRNQAPLDLDDMRVYVEAFNLSVLALGISRTHRNTITNREAVAHIQGSDANGH
jgi:hypothetical protein